MCSLQSRQPARHTRRYCPYPHPRVWTRKKNSEWLIGVLQCVAVCCSVLPCVAACCRMMQSVTYAPLLTRRYCHQPHAIVRTCKKSGEGRIDVWQYVVECCGVLQCAATCCSVLQRFAVCCSMMQYSWHTHRYSPHPHVWVWTFEKSGEWLIGVLQCVIVCCSGLQCVVAVRDIRAVTVLTLILEFDCTTHDANDSVFLLSPATHCSTMPHICETHCNSL